MPDLLTVFLVLLVAFIAGWLLRGAILARRGAGPGPEVEAAPEEPAAVRSQAPPPAPAPATATAAPRDAAELGPRIEEAVGAYDAVVDDWMDDRGEMGEAGSASLARFDAAVLDLERDAGTAHDRRPEIAALMQIAEVVRARRSEPLDARTSSDLAQLEARLGRTD